jgi:cation:H+ antiporter
VSTGVLFVVGLLLLVVGAEALVRGASRLAVAAGVTPLVVGLTVVAYGTSTPEAAVSIQAAMAGNPDIALGNVVGSNIFNVLAILGIAAVAAPLTVSTQLVRSDVPIMIGTAVLLLVLSWNQVIGRGEGVAMLALMVVYTVMVIRIGRRAAAAAPAPPPQSGGRLTTNIAFIVTGLVMLLLGARLLVDSAVTVATALGISPLVIGLTIVAAGTSMPELATSVAATIRGERDIAVGNVVGSNIFNILFVLGATSALAPAGLSVPVSALTFDIPFMIAVLAACLPIFFTGYTIERWEGAVFLGFYAAYTTYLVLHGVQHAAAPVVREVMMLFVAPLAGLTVVLIAWREWRSHRAVRRRSPYGR